MQKVVNCLPQQKLVVLLPPAFHWECYVSSAGNGTRGKIVEKRLQCQLLWPCELKMVFIPSPVPNGKESGPGNYYSLPDLSHTCSSMDCNKSWVIASKYVWPLEPWLAWLASFSSHCLEQPSSSLARASWLPCHVSSRNLSLCHC